MEKLQGARIKPSPIHPQDWIGPSAILLVVVVFYFFIPGMWGGGYMPPLPWLKTTWNESNDFEHGFMIPVICIGLLAWQWSTLREATAKGHWLGAVVAITGACFFVLAHRTGQARLAIGGLPMILWGSAWFLYGNRVAWLSMFPIFLIWLAIPVPQFQQATSQLQIISTKLAGIGCEWLGVQTEVRGTQIFSVNDTWEPLEIDEGCGGIRSLMALILISSVWAYVSKMALWKKIILCLSAFPLAIIGNMLRLTSIFVIAEHGDPEFARNTWHDWSGLVLFYPISLLLLLGVHSILEGGMPKMRQLKRSHNDSHAEGATIQPNEP